MTRRLGAAIVLVILAACHPPPRVPERLDREMTWSDLDAETERAHGMTREGVRLTFVNSPHHHMVLYLPGIRARLAALPTRQATVQFHLHRDWLGRVSEFNVFAINGEVIDVAAVESRMESLGASPADPDPFAE